MSIESTILGVKSSARLIARAPGITAVVVLALALVIGARPTILAVANSVLLSPLSSGAGQTSGQVFEGQMEWVGDDSSSSVSVNAQPEDENSSEGSSAAAPAKAPAMATLTLVAIDTKCTAKTRSAKGSLISPEAKQVQ